MGHQCELTVIEIMAYNKEHNKKNSVICAATGTTVRAAVVGNGPIRIENLTALWDEKKVITCKVNFADQDQDSLFLPC